jgi:hypothetical protein
MRNSQASSLSPDLLLPGRWRWGGYAAVVASYPVLNAVLPLHGNPASGAQQIPLPPTGPCPR